MSLEQIFSLCGSAAMAGWLLLIVLPKWKYTLGLISAGIIPFVIGLVYAGLLGSQFGSGPEGGGFGSLEGVAILFSDPTALLAGWIHYLAFDLFVGCWEVRDSQKQGINHFLVIPCLLLTFMAGPAGLALYFIVRAIKMRRVEVFAPLS